MKTKTKIKFKRVNLEHEVFYYAIYENNGVALLGFHERKVPNRTEPNALALYEYNVSFIVGADEKQCFILALDKNIYRKDIKPSVAMAYLSFAYNAIIEFEKYITKIRQCDNIVIKVSDKNNKRYNIYKYYLGKIGYTHKDNHLYKLIGHSLVNNSYL